MPATRDRFTHSSSDVKQLDFTSVCSGVIRSRGDPTPTTRLRRHRRLDLAAGRPRSRLSGHAEHLATPWTVSGRARIPSCGTLASRIRRSGVKPRQRRDVRTPSPRGPSDLPGRRSRNPHRSRLGCKRGIRSGCDGPRGVSPFRRSCGSADRRPGHRHVHLSAAQAVLLHLVHPAGRPRRGRAGRAGLLGVVVGGLVAGVRRTRRRG